jgi:protein-L-isoaspartate(D-aspartate) O-methyltransferase
LAELDLQRRWYADELRWCAGLKSPRLVEAFASVPREAFLGRGPWQLLSATQPGIGYMRTKDADPRHLSHNLLVAIDARRKLNNGHPSFLAWLIQQLDPKEGESVYHVGAGTGYYSAILAKVVGQKGRVIAIEVDDRLARRARQNLRDYRQVEVVSGNGFSHDPGAVDAILVNAGVNHLSSVWLRMLRVGGRLVVPLTLENGGGRILKATRSRAGWRARFVGPVGIYPCIGARSRSAEVRLKKALDGGGAEKVRSLRLDSHKQDRSCWLHAPGICLAR